MRDMCVALRWEREGREVTCARSLTLQNSSTCLLINGFHLAFVGGEQSTSKGSGRSYWWQRWRTWMNQGRAEEDLVGGGGLERMKVPYW